MGGACKKCERWLTTSEMGLPCPNCGSLDRIIFGVDSAFGPERETVARELAHKHYEIESGLTHVCWINSPAETGEKATEPIKLLEVNENTVPSGILPLQFGPSPASGVYFPSVIVEVTPNEFAKLRIGELRLPDGWTLGEEIPKAAHEEGRSARPPIGLPVTLVRLMSTSRLGSYTKSSRKPSLRNATSCFSFKWPARNYARLI